MTTHRDHPATPVPVPPRPWIVPALTGATFISMLHAMAIGPLIPAISDDLGAGAALLGQIPGVSMLVAAGLGLVAGPLIDRVGHRRAMTLSLLAVTASAIGMGIAPTFALLLLTALIGATGRAIVQPVALVIAGDRFDGDRQRRAISWVMAGITGAVIAGVPALTFVADRLGWRAGMVAIAAMTVLLLAALHRALGPDPATEAMTPDASGWRGMLAAYRPLLVHPATRSLLGATLVGNTGVWMMGTYIGAFYAERHGYSTEAIGWVYAVVGVALFSGSLLAGGRLGNLPLRGSLAVIRIVIGLTIFAAFTLPTGALTSLGAFGIQGLTMGVSNVFTVLLLMRESPTSRATTLTFNAAIISLSTALGSVLGGVVLAVSDFTLVGIAALALSTVAAWLVWTVPTAVRHSPTVPSSAA